jgi:uncharacterized protein (TIGR02246 family)
MNTSDSDQGDAADVKALLSGWAEAFSAMDVETILQYYSKDAVLWGTFSSELRTTPQAIRDYFSPYFSLRAHSIEIEDIFIQTYGGMAVANGLYRVSLLRENRLESARARFSFTCLKRGHRWKIVNHHSSVMPE